MDPEVPRDFGPVIPQMNLSIMDPGLRPSRSPRSGHEFFNNGRSAAVLARRTLAQPIPLAEDFGPARPHIAAPPVPPPRRPRSSGPPPQRHASDPLSPRREAGEQAVDEGIDGWRVRDLALRPLQQTSQRGARRE